MLDESEMKTLENFFKMPNENYMYFVFKLFTRLPKWYNIFKLTMELHLNMSDMEIIAMYEHLIENNYVKTGKITYHLYNYYFNKNDLEFL